MTRESIALPAAAVAIFISLVGGGFSLYTSGQQSQSSARISQREFTRAQRQIAYSGAVAYVRGLTDKVQTLEYSVSDIGFGLDLDDAGKAKYFEDAGEIYELVDASTVSEADLAIIGSSEARASFDKILAVITDMAQRVATLDFLLQGRGATAGPREEEQRKLFGDIGARRDDVLCALGDFILVARVDQLGEADPSPSTTSLPTYDICSAM